MSEIRPACFGSVVMHNPETHRCKCCPLFGDCVPAVVETRRCLDELIVSSKAAVKPIKRRKKEQPKVEEGEVEILIPASAELTQAFAHVAALPEPTPEPEVHAPKSAVEIVSAKPAPETTLEPFPETALVDGIYVELGTLPKKAREQLQRWQRADVRVQALVRGDNPFPDGPGFMRVGCDSLIARGSLTFNELENAFTSVLGWTNPSSAKSHRQIFAAALQACGVVTVVNGAIVRRTE